MMIKVLHLSTQMSWRGGENQTRLLIEGLKASGIDSYLAAPKKSAIYSYFHHKIPCFDISSKTIYLIAQGLKLAEYCRKEQIDLIDAQTSKAHSLALMVSFFYPPIKIVVHRRVDYSPGRNILSRLKYQSSRIDRFIAISEAIQKVLLDFGISSKRVALVKSAVDAHPYQGHDRQLAKEKLCQKLNIDPSALLIGAGSALSDQKGYDILLESLAILKKKHPGLKFYAPIAGDGPLRSSLEEFSKKLGLSQHVFFLGHTKDMPSFLAALDILAMPSRDEGLGTLIQEAVHSGACVVATEVGGIPEMIIHEKTGLLSPKNHPEAFAKELEKVCFSSELRIFLLKEAQKHIEEFFSVKAMIAGNIEVYRSLFSIV